MSSAIWSKPWFSPKRLSRGGRLLWFYLTTCAENTGAGIFQCDVDTAMLKTGPWRGAEWEAAVAALAGHIEFYPESWVWVVGYIIHNYEKGVNKDQRTGISRLVAQAPEELQRNFWECYQCLHGAEGGDLIIVPEKAAYYRDEGTPPPTGGGTTLPIRSSPGRTLPGGTSLSPSGDLTPAQKKDHTAAMAAFDEGMKRLTELERPVGWRKSDKGHAARFFKECLLEKDTGEDLLACIEKFFARHKGYEQRALADGKERHTAPSFTRFRNSYLSLMRAVEAQRKRDAGKA